MEKLPLKIHEANFIAGANTYDMLPLYKTPEVAFIGRSNVGKSTFINRLVNRKKLVRTSNSPGCTKQINIFKVNYSKGRPQEIHIADLPGYGYAKLSIQKRNEIAKGIVDYVRNRDLLKKVFLLIDIRREPQDDEFSILSVAREAGVKTIVLLTKSDKLTRKEIDQRLKEFNSIFIGTEIIYSLTGLNISLDTVWEEIEQVLIE